MSRHRLSSVCLATIWLSSVVYSSAGALAESTTPVRRWSLVRNNVSNDKDVPNSWDVETGHNIKWSVKVSNGAWPPGFSASPLVADGKVYIGSRNVGYVPRYPAGRNLACLLCFDESDGKLLWQYSSHRLETGRVHDSPTNPICSIPYVEKERLWMVTNRCEVVCLDTAGFYDEKNDGPYRDEETKDKKEADVIWKFDMMGELGVRPHELAGCSITGAGDVIFLNTGNALAQDHTTIPSPNALSFLAMDKNSGRVVWSDNSPELNILHGQWSSPAYAELGGQPQVVFAGGDGWLYSFDPAGDGQGGAKLLWKFDCNPKITKWRLGGRGDRNNLVAMPVIYEKRVYIAVGQDGEHGAGDGHLWCIDPTKRGDVSPELVFNKQHPNRPIAHKRFQACDPDAGDFTQPNPNSALVWHYDGFDADRDGKLSSHERFHRTFSNSTIKDDLLYITDISGIAHCVDAKTGDGCWTHELNATSFHSPLVVGSRVLIGNEDGEIVIFKHSRTQELISEIYMEDTIDCSPTVANNVLYIGTRDRLIAIESKSK